jgi:hypothetical protein
MCSHRSFPLQEQRVDVLGGCPMKPDKVKGGLIRPRRLLSLYYPIGGSAQPRRCVGVLDEGQCGVAFAVENWPIKAAGDNRWPNNAEAGAGKKG